jgi:hypothetical protein
MRRFVNDADQQLDELLQMARWPEMPAEATARLRYSIGAHRPFISWKWTALAAAASVLIAFGSAIILMHHRSARISTRISISAPVAVESTVTCRPANLYERMLLMADSRSSAKARPLSVPKIRTSPIASADWMRAELTRKLGRPGEPIDDALVESFAKSAEFADIGTIRRCIMRPELSDAAYAGLLARRDQLSIDFLLKFVLDSTTRSSALAALRAAPDPPIEALLARLDSPLVDQRFAAAKALGSLCHGQTLDTLKQMVARDDHRREALAALISCANPSTNQYLSILKRQPAIRAQFIAVQDEMKSLF